MSSLPADTPVHLAVGTTEEFLVAGVLLALAVAGTWLVLRGTRGWERRFTCLMLLGSALCIVFEPAIDAAGGIWYATVNQHLGLPRLWGVRVGVHMLFAYYLFLGVAAVAIARYVRRGATERELWRLYGAVFVLAVVLELPILYITHIYTYYGRNQPFFSHSWLPLPLWYPVLNATLPFCMATFGLLIGSTGRRAHLWLLPILMPAYLFAIYFAQGWPVLTALNTDVGQGAAYAGGVATMALALLMMHFQSLALPRLARSFSLPTDAAEELERRPERHRADEVAVLR